MKFKKVFLAVLAGSVLASSVAVSAEYNPDKVLKGSITTSGISTTNTIQNTGISYSLIVNGQKLNLKQAELYIKSDGTLMIPLRAVGEALGYQVKWINESRNVELTKGAQWILVKTSENYYSFGRMAPVKLNAAAEIANGKTYVPLNFATDILRADVLDNKSGVIEISNQQSINGIVGTIKEINSSGKSTSVLIEGNRFGRGLGEGFQDSMILLINEKSIIIDPLTDKTLSVNDLKVGDCVKGLHEQAVTASIPAQSSAVKIELLKGVAVKSGTITDVISNDKTHQILIGDMMNGIKLNITDDTKIVTQNNEILKFEDLQNGMQVEAYHSLIVTRSIPPISTAYKIVVTNAFDDRPIVKQGVHYEIVRETTGGGNEIYYPQVRNYKGQLYMDYINQSLKKIADKYNDNNAYSKLKLDYEVTRMDNRILSVLYKGTAEMKDIGKISIQESVSLDMLKSSNEIEFDNLVKSNEKARNAVIGILNEKAKEKGLSGFEAEGVRLYFTEENIVFYYMPLDDSAREFVELTIPEKEIIQYINFDFNEGPAS